MTYKTYLVVFRGEQRGPFLDLYAARRHADHLRDGHPRETRIQVAEINDDGLIDVGLCGWKRRPFEVAL
jgi:hypothetical protein